LRLAGRSAANRLKAGTTSSRVEALDLDGSSPAIAGTTMNSSPAKAKCYAAWPFELVALDDFRAALAHAQRTEGSGKVLFTPDSSTA